MDFEKRPESRNLKKKYLTRLFSVFQHQFSLVHSFFGLTSDTEFARVLKIYIKKNNHLYIFQNEK